jgi:predicted ABC-type exoprotein transport system permease subunit
MHLILVQIPLGSINCAREETTVVMDRSGGSLVPQDVFIREHVRADDVICISVGMLVIASLPLVFFQVIVFSGD